LSNNQFDDAAPQLSQTHVAWLGKDHTDKSDVYLYDLAGLANEIDAVNISNTSFNTSAIQLDGENVVWVAEETGNDSVYLYTNSDHQSRKISTGGSNLHPQIDGSRVVWEHFAVAGSASNWDIALYDFGQGIAEAETTMLQNPYGLDDVAPQIDGDWVVWQANFESESDIYAYNIHHESLENISASNYGYDTAPGLAGDRLVWRANVEGEWEVRYVDLDVPSFIPRTISVDGDYDWSPMISDSMIAWRSHTGEGYTIVSAKQDAPRVKGTLSLNIVGEQVVEEDEHFFVDIVDTQFGIFGEEIGDDGSARIDILNDDGSLDFGDAPASYSTLMADDGARHATELSNLFLYAPPMAGPAVTPIDAEDDGHPSADALGDDQSISIDENGVIFQGDWTAGETAWVSVYASAPGYLNAWVDWNADGNWGDDKTDLVDTAEQIFLGQELVAGENLLSFRVPKRAAVGETYARFRFSSQEQLSFHGSALDGEVEDYKVTVQPGHTDPVYLDGRTVIIDGTALDDEVVIKRDDAQVNHRLTVELNGRQFDFNPADADRVEFNGIRGDDDVTVFGSGEYEYVEMFPEAATIEGRNLQITIENAPGITFYGEGGGDRVDMFDSTDNDTFVVHPNEGEMSSYYYRNAAYDVQVIGGFANAGGRDEAWMYGSLDADRLDSYGNLARLSDQALSYISRATAFDTVYTLDSGGDEDVAHLRDTDGNQELFWANGFEASMTRRGMLHQVSGFETVEAESIGGVGDVGRFYDTVRDDVFIASADVATMYAVDPNSPQGNPQNLYTVTATGFDRYAAISQRGGFDSAFLEDPAGKNHLEAIQKELKLYDIDVDGEVIFQLLAFDQVTIDSGDAAGLNSRDIEDKASDAVFELIFTDEDPWTDI
jgi:hypothetical protein